MSDWLAAIILGLVEGLTEFIPVSSTGHMLLLGHFIGFESAGKTFEIVIQLGALLAIVSVYFKKLWTLATRWPFDAEARRFLIGLLVAFAPAVVIGFLAYDFINSRLEPESGKALIENYGYGASTQTAFAAVPQDKLDSLGLPSDPQVVLESTIFTGPMKQNDELAKMFERIKAGG